MSYVKIEFNTSDIEPKHQEAVGLAVAQLLRLTSFEKPQSVAEGAFWGRTPTDDVPIKGDEVTLTVHDETTTLAPPAEEKPKPPKRKRRTKAQIAADKAMKEAKATAPLETFEVDPVSEALPDAVLAPAEAVDTDPLSDVEYTELDVKAAVVKEVERLTEAGYDSPTRAVVEKLVVLTGKPKVSEIDASLYAKVIFGLSSS